MKNKTLFFCLFLLIFFSSCSALTESQIKNINAFASATKAYTQFPSEMVKKSADLVLEERTIETIQVGGNPDLIKKGLSAAQANYDTQEKIADNLDLSLQLIQQYASLLAQLSSDNFNKSLTTNTNDLNDNLGNLIDAVNPKINNKIPAGVKNVITKTILLVGTNLTKSKQAKALKEFIPEGDTLIQATAQNIQEALENDFKPVLFQEQKRFDDTYTNNILSKTALINLPSLNEYLKGINDYKLLEQMRVKTISAAKKLAAAHSKLNSEMQQKKTLTEIFNETQDFIVSVKDVIDTYKKLSSSTK